MVGLMTKARCKSLTQRFSLISLLTFPNSQENTPRLCGAPSIWLMTQAARWGQIQKIPKNAEEMAEKAGEPIFIVRLLQKWGLSVPSKIIKWNPRSIYRQERL